MAFLDTTRIGVSISKETKRELDDLTCFLGENVSQVIRRAIAELYIKHKQESKDDK